MAAKYTNMRMNIRTARLKVVELANYIYKHDPGKHMEILADAYSFLPEKFQKMLDYKVK